MGIAVAGGAGYIVYDKIKKRNTELLQDENDDTIIINNNLPSSSSNSFLKKLTRSDNFPLKHGSSGSRVTALQTAIANIIGSSAMNVSGGIDGQFGPGTVKALKMAGFPAQIDEATFNRITGQTGSSLQIIFNPADIALKLFRAGQGGDSQVVLSLLRQIKTVSDYSTVNEYYKRQGFISKTIVTDLLDFVFKDDESVKSLLRNEFQRIGLKTDDAGRWSLQGILHKDLITLRETVVTDIHNNRIPVQRNTILGDAISVQNGMTWFRSIDQSILKVPTQDVKYS